LLDSLLQEKMKLLLPVCLTIFVAGSWARRNEFSQQRFRRQGPQRPQRKLVPVPQQQRPVAKRQGAPLNGNGPRFQDQPKRILRKPEGQRNQQNPTREQYQQLQQQKYQQQFQERQQTKQQPAPQRIEPKKTFVREEEKSQPQAPIYREPVVEEIQRRNFNTEDNSESESFQNRQQAYYRPNQIAQDRSSGYPAPPEQASIEKAVAAGAAGYNADEYEEAKRLAFQIHGQEGPDSYRFGYDTGVGYNRQFRYESRDSKGVLHGRYGYYDQEGKLQIVTYRADPQTGFHADGDHVPKPQY